MAGLTEFYCPSNETSLGSQFKWLEYTFNRGLHADIVPLTIFCVPDGTAQKHPCLFIKLLNKKVSQLGISE